MIIMMTIVRIVEEWMEIIIRDVRMKELVAVVDIAEDPRAEDCPHLQPLIAR